MFNDDRGITKKCTGVAGRVETEINVAGRNPVILGVDVEAEAVGLLGILVKFDRS